MHTKSAEGTGACDCASQHADLRPAWRRGERQRSWRIAGRAVAAHDVREPCHIVAHPHPDRHPSLDPKSLNAC